MMNIDKRKIIPKGGTKASTTVSKIMHFQGQGCPQALPNLNIHGGISWA